VSHKHDGEHHHENLQYQTGDSPTKPLHVKLVPSENECTPKSENLNSTSDNKKKPTKERQSPDWWMVIPTIVLAIFAMGSFSVLWIQLVDARKAFVKDQRPYVWIADNTADHPNIYVEEGLLPVRFAVTVHYTNFGKSPAVRLRWGSEITIVGRSDNIDYLSKVETILPTTKDDFVILASDAFPANFPNVAPLHSVIIRLRWRYADTSGHWYETETCNWNLTRGAWGPCETGNEIRDCSEQTCYY